MKQYSLIYRTQDNAVFRFDTQAASRVEALSRLHRQIGTPPRRVEHIIEHVPIDESKPQLRFLAAHLPLEGKLPPDLPTRKGAILLRLSLRSTDTHLDNVQERIREALVDIGVPDTHDLMDPIMAKLKEEAATPSWLFSLHDWPYDKDRYDVTTVGTTVVVADYDEHLQTIHEDLGDALYYMVEGTQCERATLYLELWPAVR